MRVANAMIYGRKVVIYQQAAELFSADCEELGLTREANSRDIVVQRIRAAIAEHDDKEQAAPIRRNA